MMFAPPVAPPTAWTYSPNSDGKWYSCAHFTPSELRKIVPPGTLIAVPKT